METKSELIRFVATVIYFNENEKAVKEKKEVTQLNSSMFVSDCGHGLIMLFEMDGVYYEVARAMDMDDAFRKIHMKENFDDFALEWKRNLESDLLEGRTYPNLLYIMLYASVGRLDLSNKLSELRDIWIKKKEDEFQKEMEMKMKASLEKKRLEQEKYEIDLDTAYWTFKRGDSIDGELFLGLLKRYEIPIPRRTIGLIRNNSLKISMSSIQYNKPDGKRKISLEGSFKLVKALIQNI